MASKPTGRPTGRPRKYTEALADEVCRRIAEGESLRRITRDPHIPSLGTVIKWRREVPGFLQQYAQAMEDRADTYADEIIDIADEEADPQKARVRVDARKWVASKLKSKAYGDKVDHKHEGNVGFTVVTGVPERDSQNDGEDQPDE